MGTYKIRSDAEFWTVSSKPPATGVSAAFNLYNGGVLRGALITSTDGSSTSINSYTSGGVIIDSPISISNAAAGAISINRPLSLAASNGIAIADGAPGTTTDKLYQVGHTLYFNGTALSTGGGGTTTNALTIGNGLSGGSFNGSSAVTIAVSAANNTTAASYFPLFATSQGTSVALGTNSGLTFNPSTGALGSVSHTLTVASSVPALSITRSDLSNTITLTPSAADVLTSSAQIVLPSDPATAMQTATKQYTDNQLASVQPTAVAAAVGPWTAYTPVWSGTTTNPVINNGSIGGMWRRVGDSMELEVTIVMGSGTTYGSGSYGISIPSGYNIDFTKVSNNSYADFGIFSAQGGSGVSTDGIVRAVSTTTNVLYPWFGVANVSPTIPFTFANGNTLTLRATLPIVQWSANINLLTSFTEYAYNSSTTTTDDTTSFGYGSDGVLVKGFAPGGTGVVIKRVNFTSKIQPTDLLTVEFNNGNGWFLNYFTASPILNSTTALAGCILQAVDSNNVNVLFFSSAFVSGTTWTTLANANWKWRVRKTSNGNFAQGSPSYSQTIGDGTNTTIVVTHNLGVTDCDVSIFELTGNKRKVDSGVEIRSTSNTQITLVFSTAPALNSLRVIVFGNGGTQAMGDRLSPIANAENIITAATTGIVGRWNKCTATSANYALTLPSAASCAGQTIGIRIDGSSTYLVTVTANGAELIDGSNTRVMWAGENAELYSDGVGWTKIGGRSIPMSSSLTVTSNQTFAATTNTLLNFTSSVFNNAPAAFQTAASSRINILRPGKYNCSYRLLSNNSNTSNCQIYLYITVNGVTKVATEFFSPGSNNAGGVAYGILSLAAGDYVQPYAYYNTGSFPTSFFYTAGGSIYNAMEVTEVITW